MTDNTRRRAAAWFWLGLIALTLSATPFLVPGTTRAATVSVAAENYDFSPSSRTISAGDTVRWTFSGDQHSVTSRDGLFDSGIKDAGGSFQFRFTKAGTYRYYCVVHPGLMSGTVVVRAAAATPKPTVRPTPSPTPKPTPRATVKPAATPTTTPTRAAAAPSASPSPSASVAPTNSPGASEAVVQSPGPSTVPPSAAPAPEPPATTSDTTPIVVGGAVLAVVALVGGLLLARRRRSI